MTLAGTLVQSSAILVIMQKFGGVFQFFIFSTEQRYCNVRGQDKGFCLTRADPPGQAFTGAWGAQEGHTIPLGHSVELAVLRGKAPHRHELRNGTCESNTAPGWGVVIPTVRIFGI